MTCLSDNHQNLGMTDSLVSPNLLDLASAFARHVHYQIVDNSCKFSQDNLDAPCSDDSFFVRSLANENPTRKEVLNVIKNIYNLAKIDTDCIVLSLVYINRFQSVSKILINNSN